MHGIGILRAIAIVGDDPQTSRTLEPWLTSAGIGISSHPSAEKMVAALRRSGNQPTMRVGQLNPHPCRLVGVLIDLNLPGINGVDLARALKRWYPELPLILVAERDHETDKLLADLPSGVPSIDKRELSIDTVKASMSSMLV